MYSSKCVNDIIKEINIPHTTAYRKINWLLQVGFLAVDKIEITHEAKKFGLFLSTLKSLTIKYEYNSLVIEAEQNFDITKQLTQR